MEESIDVWREFFRTTAGADVFEFIDKAIAIAALDRPKDLLLRRDRIAERLFSRETTVAGGDRVLSSKESEENGNMGTVARDVVNIKESQREAKMSSDDVKENQTIKGRSEVEVDIKFQATKRKMQELYKKAEADKRRRTIRVVDPRDLPKIAPPLKASRATKSEARWRRAGSQSRVSCF